jgi:phage tail-like protein
VSSKARAAASAPELRQPFTSLRFAVGIERLGAFGAVEVVLPESRVVRAGRRKSIVHSALTLRRGLTSATEWYDWWFESRRRPSGSKRRVTLELLDAAGVPRIRWFFPDSVPQAYAVSPLSALHEAVVLESLELAVGDFVLQKRE